jgi:hypothetical protein
LETGHQNSHQQCDNRDYHQKLNQRKPTTSPHRGTPSEQNRKGINAFGHTRTMILNESAGCNPTFDNLALISRDARDEGR